MKPAITLAAIIVTAVVGLAVGYVIGEIRGYTLGAKTEMISAMVFLLSARAGVENANSTKAISDIDKGLAAQSEALLKLQEGGPKQWAATFAASESPVRELVKVMPNGINMQRTPVPPDVYRYFNLPVIERKAGAAPAPPRPSTGDAAAPAGSNLPPGMFRQ